MQTSPKIASVLWFVAGSLAAFGDCTSPQVPGKLLSQVPSSFVAGNGATDFFR